MAEVTDLMRVAQYVKSDKGAPSDVYNAACRLLAAVYADALDALLPPRGAESHQDAQTGAYGTPETAEAPRDAQEAAQ